VWACWRRQCSLHGFVAYLIQYRRVALEAIRLPDGNPPQYDDLEVMPATVRLNDIVEALETQFDDSSSFLDRDTGKLETVSHDLLREAEEFVGDEMPDLPT
jgi:hypothetical protein